MAASCMRGSELLLPFCCLLFLLGNEIPCRLSDLDCHLPFSSHADFDVVTSFPGRLSLGTCSCVISKRFPFYFLHKKNASLSLFCHQSSSAGFMLQYLCRVISSSSMDHCVSFSILPSSKLLLPFCFRALPLFIRFLGDSPAYLYSLFP
jgi:hypothetical protein